MPADPIGDPGVRAIAGMAASLRRTDAPARLSAGADAFLREAGIEDADDRAAMAAQADRLMIYRTLVHNRIKNAIRDFVPRTLARLGRAPFGGTFDRYMDELGPQSPYLRDVPEEFVNWAAPIWKRDASVPDYIVDLARHELLELVVRNDPRGGEPATGVPVALDRGIRFDGSVRLCHYAHPVHELPRGLDDKTAPDARSTDLLVYRDAQGRVRYLELTPFAAAVVAALLTDRLALEPALRRACAVLDEPLDDDKLAGAASLLADLGERGVALGADE